MIKNDKQLLSVSDIINKSIIILIFKMQWDSDNQNTPPLFRRESSIGSRDRERLDQLIAEYLSPPRIDYLAIDDFFLQLPPPIVERSSPQPLNLVPQANSPLSQTATHTLMQTPTQQPEPILPVVPIQPTIQANNSIQNVPVQHARNYKHKITLNTTHLAIRYFYKDILCLKKYRAKCNSLEVDYSDFLAFLKRIEIDNRISNKTLLIKYLKPQPQDNDTQRKFKIMFEEYFNYFLEYELNNALRQSKIKDKKRYQAYAVKYLFNLSVTDAQIYMRQDTPTR